MQKRPLIIAVDFDGTLFEGAYPKIGAPRYDVIEYCRMQQLAGAIIILWTCREGKLLEDAVAACREVGLLFDVINDNAPGMVEEFGTNPRKIFANEYIDDRNSVMFPVK